MIDLTILEKIEKISNINFKLLLEKIALFFENDYQNIVDYYTGQKTLSTPSSFENFRLLSSEFQEKHLKLFQFNKQLLNSEYTDFLEKLESINDRLIYVDNLDRWLRSSISSNVFYNNLQLDYILSQGETLEKVSRNLLKRTDFLDNWLDLALSNQLLEEDYTSEGGVLIQVPLDNSVVSYSLNSVVDVITEKSCYGKDLDRTFLFSEEDLVVLDYRKTIEQSIEILVTLKKGDNLDLPTLGLQQDIFVGSNRSYFNTPILIRQLSENFLTDDTLINFHIKEIKLEQDNFFIDFQVNTILGELVNLASKF